MKAADFRSIIRLTNEERWGFGARDLKRMLALESRGCLVATTHGHTIGLTTTISYGNKLGWIGNVVVSKKHRHAGIGSSLVQSALKHLRRKHVKSIGLYSYHRNESMYKRLGFRTTGAFVRLSISRGTSRQAEDSREIPFRQIIRLDKRTFGADRSRLLRHLLREFPGNWTWILNETKVTGYSLVKQYEDSSEIGPSVCGGMNQTNVTTLLESSIGLTKRWPLEMSVPESNSTVLETARGVGFRVEKKGVVMSCAELDPIEIGSGIVAFGFLDKG